MRRLALRPDLLLVAAAAFLWLLGAALPAPEQKRSRFVQDDVRILAHGGRTTLAVTILRPRGPGPFGAVVLNHGVAATEQARERESPALLIHTATAFAQRGYVVVLPLRRGFGATGGAFAEDPGHCADPDFFRAEREAAADVLAAYDFARKLPYVDGSRMLLAGQSAGGVAALYAAAHSPEGLQAVLAFAAGRGGRPAHHPGIPCAAERLAAVFEEAGRRVRAPVLLHYAENDRFFGPSASGLWFKRFKSGGGEAEYVLQPPFGADGHYLFSSRDGVERWLPAVERFLSRHGISFGAAGQRV